MIRGAGGTGEKAKSPEGIIPELLPERPSADFSFFRAKEEGHEAFLCLFHFHPEGDALLVRDGLERPFLPVPVRGTSFFSSLSSFRLPLFGAKSSGGSEPESKGFWEHLIPLASFGRVGGVGGVGGGFFWGGMYEGPAPPGYRWVPFRSWIWEASGLEGPDRSRYYGLVSRGRQLLLWARSMRYCPSCARPLKSAKLSFSRLCGFCGKEYFPPVSPAVIMGIMREGKLLLVRRRREKPSDQRLPFHTVLAGFVEAGESAEEAVVREVKEECGLRVRYPVYTASQSWPFPHSLMLGFTAEAEAGELRLCEAELESAGWFAPEEIPAEIPPPVTLARQIIDCCARKLSGR